MKKITTIVFTIISLFCILYYTKKYYVNQELNFDKDNFMLWLVLMIVLVVTLILGIINLFEVNKTKRQNEKLLDLIISLSKEQGEFKEEVLEVLLNSRDISVDCINEIKNNNKGES